MAKAVGSPNGRVLEPVCSVPIRECDMLSLRDVVIGRECHGTGVVSVNDATKDVHKLFDSSDDVLAMNNCDKHRSSNESPGSDCIKSKIMDSDLSDKSCIGSNVLDNDIVLCPAVTDDVNAPPWNKCTWWCNEVLLHLVQESDGIDVMPDLCSVSSSHRSEMALIEVNINNASLLALLDTGASKSFILPSRVSELGLSVTNMPEPVVFRIATNGVITVQSYVHDIECKIGPLTSRIDLLVATIPYDIILGRPWMRSEGLIWDMSNDKICFKRGTNCIELPLKSDLNKDINNDECSNEMFDWKTDREKAEIALQQMLSDIKVMKPNDAAAFVRPTPKRYKNFRNKRKRVPIKDLLKQVHASKIESLNDNNVVSVLDEVDVYESLDVLHELGPYKCEESVFNKDPEDVIDPWLYFKENYHNMDCCLSIVPVKDANIKRGVTHELFEDWLSVNQNDKNAWIIPLLIKYKHLFVDALPIGLPPKRVIDHTITLMPGALPPKGAIYKFSQDDLNAERETVMKLRECEWITLTSSPFAAPTIIVNKKSDPNGKEQKRMVVNYQGLNALTIAPEYPLPTIQAVLENLHGAKVFTIMDMEQGFHQIRVHPRDQYKTAFRTHFGQYEYKVMPFGLRGAPGTFQAVMNHMFFELLGKGVIAYLDDVLVYSKDESSHLVLLDKVLNILSEHKMYPKFVKCQFGTRELDYLGYHISDMGITPSPEKVEAISIWPEVLCNDTQVKQFLGTINYCRMFIGPSFADMARPLVELTKKGNAFKWEQCHTDALKALKKRLIDYTTLQVPDNTKPYVLRTDASGYAIGAVLEQDGKPVGFMSKKMSDAEQRYATYDQELLALVRALEKWKPLLAPS